MGSASNSFDLSQYDFIEVADLAEIPDGERLILEIDELPVVIFNIAGQFYAVDDCCTHDDGPLGDGTREGFQIVCPRHGARFDLQTGKVLSYPAAKDINIYPVRVASGKIELGLPKQQG